MPDESGFPSLRCFPDGLDSMDLIRAKKNHTLRLAVQNYILRHHLVGFRNAENLLSKFKIIGYRLILGVAPPAEELLI